MIEVSPHVLRGPRPLSVQELRDKDIKHVLSLESGTFALLHEDNYERALAQAFDIRPAYIDCSGIWPPEKHDVYSALNVISYAIYHKENIYVHCKAGVDRTGFIIAVFRMQICGWSYEAALAEYKDRGLHKRFYWWAWNLKGYAKAAA